MLDAEVDFFLLVCEIGKPEVHNAYHYFNKYGTEFETVWFKFITTVKVNADIVDQRNQMRYACYCPVDIAQYQVNVPQVH